VSEGGRPGANWTAFLLKGSATGTLTGAWFNKIAKTEATLASAGISIVVDELLGFVNSNTFEFLRTASCRNFAGSEMADLDYTTGSRSGPTASPTSSSSATPRSGRRSPSGTSWAVSSSSTR
jgi:hypothetical protein